MNKFQTVLVLFILILSFIVLSIMIGNFNFAIDHIVNLFGQSIDGNNIITKIFLFIAWLGDVTGVIILLLFIICYFLFKKDFYKIILLTTTMLVTVCTSTLIKLLVHRERPENMIMDYHGFSFPSGHATMAILFYGLLLFLFLPSIKSKINKYILITGLTSLGVLVMFSRIYLSVHWFTDILGGVLLGSFYLILSISIYKNYNKKN